MKITTESRLLRLLVSRAFNFSDTPTIPATWLILPPRMDHGYLVLFFAGYSEYFNLLRLFFKTKRRLRTVRANLQRQGLLREYCINSTLLRVSVKITPELLHFILFKMKNSNVKARRKYPHYCPQTAEILQKLRSGYLEVSRALSLQNMRVLEDCAENFLNDFLKQKYNTD